MTGAGHLPPPSGSPVRLPPPQGSSKPAAGSRAHAADARGAVSPADTPRARRPFAVAFSADPAAAFVAAEVFAPPISMRAPYVRVDGRVSTFM